MDNRVIKEGLYIVKEDATIRETANKFRVSKSLIHKDIHTKLNKLDINLYCDVMNVLKKHNINKHIHGGLATKNKYQRGNI